MQQLRNFMDELNRSLSTDAARVALILILLVIAFRRPILQWLRDRRAPRLAVSAAVGEKRSELVTVKTQYGKMRVMEYHVSFRLDDGACLTFRVEEAEYTRLTEGARGTLSCQGSRFLGFAREAES